MDDAWVALTKYKFLLDKVNELKRRVWSELPPEVDVGSSIQEAEEELLKLKAWIELHYEMKKMD